jgi:hypothetical protein
MFANLMWAASRVAKTLIERARVGVGLAAATVGTAAFLSAPTPSNAALIYGVTFDNTLFSFDSASPGNILSGVAISGLQSNEFIQGIDFRPSTNVLYGLGNSNRVYTINLSTGVATPVAGSFAPPALSGTAFGVDFNPVADRIRIHSDTQQNLRLHPDTGLVVATDPALQYQAGDTRVGQDPNIIASAYNNNVAGAVTTTLFSLDSGFDQLNQHNTAPGFQDMQTVAPLTNAANGQAINLGDYTGFDIDTTGVAHIMWNNASGLYGTLNLTNGQVSNIATIGGGLFIRDITTVIPEPGALALLGLGALAVVRRRTQ